jgi:transcription antitermination factor NusG
VFVRWRRDTDWGSLRRLPFVWQLLMSDYGKPAVVPDALISNLQARTSPRRIVDDPLWAPPPYVVGQRVAVIDGPLAGLAGVCKMSAGERIRLLFELLGREVIADFSPAEVMAADEVEA